MLAKDAKPGDIFHWSEEDVTITGIQMVDDEEVILTVKAPSGNEETSFSYRPDEEASPGRRS